MEAKKTGEFLISQFSTEKSANGRFRMLSKSSAAWRTIGDKRIYCRSTWEANFARYLQLLKEHKKILDWQHECKTFWFENIKRGVRSYLPDFFVINLDESNYWVEVKGFYDSKSLTKIKRFRKYYPNEKLILVDKKWFAQNSNKLRGLIKDWEKKYE